MSRIISKLRKYVKYNILGYQDFNQRHVNYEYERFQRYALGKGQTHIYDYLDTQLKIYIHIIEKGFSFNHIKKGFGKEKLMTILNLLKQCEDENYFPESYYKAVRILSFYCKYADENNVDISYIDKRYRTEKDLSDVGYAVFSDVEILDKMNFYDFAHARHSIRYFSSKKVSNDDIINAVKLAQTAPSACNREAVNVYCLTDTKKIESVLEIQEGAKGFENVTALFIITAKLSRYTYIKEYSTPYVDGGIFMMNLMYALNYYKIASCPLMFDDSEIYGGTVRKIVDIPKGEVIIGLIASGIYSDNDIKYAKSTRQEVENTLKML